MQDVNEFRPSALAHLIGQQHVKEVVQTAFDFSFQELTELPHGLALGPPGRSSASTGRGKTKVVRKKMPAASTGLSPNISLLQAAAQFLTSAGSADAAIEAIRQVQALQLG